MNKKRNLTYGELLGKLKIPVQVVRGAGSGLAMRPYVVRVGGLYNALEQHCSEKGERIPHDTVLCDEVMAAFEDLRNYHNEVWGDEWGKIE